MAKFRLLAASFSLFVLACGSSAGGDSDAGDSNSDAGLVVLCEATCESDEVCVDGVCCDDLHACEDQCCEGESICSFGGCVVPGNDCFDGSECGAGEYCEGTLGDLDVATANSCVGSTAPLPGKCLPRPPVCPDGETPDDPNSCLVACEYVPEAGNFAPALKYEWGDVTALPKTDNVMMTPIVVQLDDDNCDEVINERDIPEIIFSTFVREVTPNGEAFHAVNGSLHAISIIEGEVVEKWTVDSHGQTPSINPGRHLAGGNIDGKPGNEIVVCLTDSSMRAYSGEDGTELWTSPPVSCLQPAIADLDQDGVPEVISNGFVLDGATGTIEQSGLLIGGYVTGYDMTGDGKLDLAGTYGVATAAGDLVGIYTQSDGSRPQGTLRSAIGDLDLDGTPEIVIAEPGSHLLHIFQIDMSQPGNTRVIRENIDINGSILPSRCPERSAGFTRGGGPPTIADTNGDGFPDVAMAGGVGYTVFDGKKLMDTTVNNPDTIMWAKETQDCSSAQTGSSVFDFNGDGRAEVVYADEVLLHIYDGMTGNVLFETCNTNGTLTEYPVIADVDSDGRADIVVASNNYGGSNCEGEQTTGVRVFGDTQGDWVRTRTIWNQHAYQVTNVLENGDIPRVQKSNHLDPNLNNYRLNVQPLGEFSAPDLRAELYSDCASQVATVRVRNFGEASAPAGVPVQLYIINDGVRTPVEGGPFLTQHPLYPAEAEDLTIDVVGDLNFDSMIQAVVDESPESHLWQECHLDNNQSETVAASCTVE